MESEIEKPSRVSMGAPVRGWPPSSSESTEKNLHTPNPDDPDANSAHGHRGVVALGLSVLNRMSPSLFYTEDLTKASNIARGPERKAWLWVCVLTHMKRKQHYIYVCICYIYIHMGVHDH